MPWVNRFLLVGALLFALPAYRSVAQIAPSGPLHPSLSEARDRVRQSSGGSLELVQLTRHGSPALLIGHPDQGEAWFAPSAPKAAIQAALVTRLGQLQSILSLPGASELTLTNTDRVGRLWHATLVLGYYGIPVRDRTLNLNFGLQTGRFVSVTNNLPIAVPSTSTAAFPASDLTIERLSSYVRSSQPLELTSKPKLVYVEDATGDGLVLCYEAELRDVPNEHLWRTTVDATSGVLVSIEDELEHLGDTRFSGRVLSYIHPHSPFDSTLEVGMPGIEVKVGPVTVLTDSNGYWSATAPDTTTNASVAFAGPHHAVIRFDSASATLNAALSASVLFQWSDSNSSAAERDAFYSTTIAHDFAHQLDSSLSDLDSSTPVFVNLNQTCNAFYDPSLRTLNFYNSGNNCSNTAEISDVVYHEYGHRMLHARYGNTQHGNIVNASLNEGLADIFSALLRDDSRIGIGFFSNNCNAVLRDCFNIKTFPRDISVDPHVSGMMVSGSLWDLRRLVGRATTLRLFADAIALCPDAANTTNVSDLSTAFTAMLIDVLAADDTDNDLTNGTPHLSQILTAFCKHGISLSNLISVSSSMVPDQDSVTDGYPVTVTASYSAPIGQLAEDSVQIYYTFDNGHSYSSVVAQHLHDSVFSATIPKAPAGTTVKYYAAARTTIPEGGTAFFPSIFDPATFLVGYRTVSLDDAEADRGWQLGASTDKATSGLWVRDVPFGTYQVPGIYIQQDTDHTPNGVACYLTGNKHTRSYSEDDVDSGSTTLMTPSFDLSQVSSPVVRFWYYYYNSIGFNAGRVPWIVQISNDDGATWKSVLSTNSATQGWQPYTFRVSDKIQPTATMRMRFVATDYYLTIVEAGVDDFQILAGPDQPLSGVRSSSVAFGLGLPSHNPSRHGESVSVDIISDRPRHVVLTLKNVLGDVVQTLLDAPIGSGEAGIKLSTSSLPSGTYWLTLTDGVEQSIRRLVIR